MNARLPTLLLAGTIALLGACDRDVSDGPPNIRLDDSVCVQCNMIISDARFATATIIEGPRGPEPLLFDDFNCQVNHEVEHPEEHVLRRWSHDYKHARWIETGAAHFVMAKELRTPMASHTAAFATRDEAEAAAGAMGGETMDFKTAWKRLGFAGACCPAGHGGEHDSTEGGTDAP